MLSLSPPHQDYHTALLAAITASHHHTLALLLATHTSLPGHIHPLIPYDGVMRHAMTHGQHMACMQLCDHLEHGIRDAGMRGASQVSGQAYMACDETRTYQLITCCDVMQ